MKFTTYQQIEFMVDNGVCLTIDSSYETGKIIVSGQSTSLFTKTVEAETLNGAIQKMFDFASAKMGHTIGIDD